DRSLFAGAGWVVLVKPSRTIGNRPRLIFACTDDGSPEYHSKSFCCSLVLTSAELGGEKYTVNPKRRGLRQRQDGCGQGKGGAMRRPDRTSRSMKVGLPIPLRRILPETANEYSIGRPRTTANCLSVPFSFTWKWRALQKSARKPRLESHRP